MIKYLNFLLFFFIFSGKINSQEISGKIIDAATGEGIENATITVDSSNEVFLTDQNGEFRFLVSQFPVTVEISVIGFQSDRQRFRKAGQDRTISLIPIAEPLSEVIVRSALIPKRLRQMPAAVNILTRSDLRRKDGSTLVGALNAFPGVFVHQGALNTNKMSVRGVGARSQYSTNRVKAYFQGIPISTAEGETTLDDIDPNSIGKVEIIKGPNSSMYGAGLGGVINLYAAEAEKFGTEGKIENLFGSFGLNKKSLSLSQASENMNLFANYDHLKTDSFRENGDYDRKSFNLHGKISAGSSDRFSLLASFTRLLAYIPSSISLEQMQVDPTSAAFTWKASRGYESYDKGLLGLAYEQELSSRLRNTTSIYINFKDAYEPRPFDVLKEDQTATGAKTKFNLTSRIFGAVSEFSAGAEYNREWYDSATFQNLYEEFPGQGSIRGDHLSDNSQLRSYYNIFGQWNLSLSQRLKMETGININGTSYQLIDLFLEDEVDQTGKYDFGTVISPRIAAIYELSGKTLYANISQGFSTPTVAETLTPEGLINLDLKPEKGVNYEIGFKGNWWNNSLYSEVALYSIQVENLLVAERVAEDRYIGRNAGKTDHNGIDIFLRSDFVVAPGITAKPYFNAAFNFFEFEEFNDNGRDHSGNNLPGVPNKTINAGVDLISDLGLSLYANLFHSGEIPLNDANSRYNESYQLVNFKAAYSQNIFNRVQLELSAGINNAFNEKYAASILPNAVGFGGASPRFYYPGNPRNYFGGVGFSYLF